MPLYWINSMLMSFLLMIVLVILYNYVKDFYILVLKEKGNDNYYIEW